LLISRILEGDLPDLWHVENLSSYLLAQLEIKVKNTI
jgi:hypothetical protein